MTKLKDSDNDWAKTIKQDPVHIEDARSGKKGYYCLGCNKEMEAVIQKKDPRRRSFFRHLAKDVNRETAECVVASKEYRERLAEQILHRLKRIKVPPLYKYPPKGEEGHPMFLQDSTILEATTVRSQLSFYEDEDGEIHWGKNPEIHERNLLLRPDISFFDHHSKPILFIEFVITHKINDEKRIKLKRLGIDTIQIIIPKKPEREIEKTLTSIRSTKWIYNGKEANSSYVQPASGNSGAVLDLDEDQRKLFEESFKCRSSEIKNLIRAIKRGLGSESYRKAEQLLEREISRIEDAARQAKSKLEDLERENGEEIEAKLQGEFAEEEDEFGARREKFTNFYNRVAERYRELEAEFRGKRRDIEKEARDLDALIRDIEEPESIEGEFRKKLSNLSAAEAEERRRGRRVKKELEEEIRNIEHQIQSFGSRAEQEEIELKRGFEDLRDQTVEKISQRDGSGDQQLSERIEDVLRAGRISSNFTERQSAAKRTREALDFIRSGTWKNQ